MAIRHSNHLINESSPYLLQHAHNPVDWFAWGLEALQAAKEQNKPILVSIGYAACHWCHVMEKESFENEATAALMNKYFINIKIDREERPDLDHFYMDAVQTMTGSGGWPLNVFLTPDTKPFYGGTYFPPQKAFNRPSWPEVLNSINEAWHNRKEEIEAQAEELVAHIKKSNNLAAVKNVIQIQEEESYFTKPNCKIIADNILKSADGLDGGFGKAPKFPQTFSLQFLLQYSYYFNNSTALKHVEFSLQKMINGGIYDQLGGGLCRYSTDSFWLAPHFEKMLYDNALLIIVLCDVYQLTKNQFYKTSIKKTIDFINAEMRHPKGGYYAALDADSEGEEGKFYVWDKEEIDRICGSHSPIYCSYYNVSKQGNWEGRNILNINELPSTTAQKFGLSLSDLNNVISECNTKLLAERNKRIRPITDDKILLGWNALLLTALCKSYSAIQEESYKIAALGLFNFIELKFSDNVKGGLHHTYKDGLAKYPAFLDDYAYYIQACIHLQEITSDQTYLKRAKELAEFVLMNFSEEENNFFFYTNKFQKDILVRKIELHDGATPSANAIMCNNLLYLSIIFDIKEWRNRAVSMEAAVSEAVIKYPTSFAIWANLYLVFSFGINEIAVLGKNHQEILKYILGEYIPSKVLQSSNTELDMPLFIGKSIPEVPEIYLCSEYECQQPVKTCEELLLLIKNRIP